jgi:hypothetical protein
VVIPYGTILLAEKTRDDYITTAKNQVYFDVPIVEFDDFREDVIVGTYRFQCKPKTPPRSRIAVTFKYDQSASIEVDARDLQSGELLSKERVQYQEPDLNEKAALQLPSIDASELEILFLFDTTGSMYPYLERVREHLAKIVEEIHSELSDARIAIMAHGDHCDERNIYLVKSCPFSTNTKDLVEFIRNVERTGGGDTPEAIEDALWEARRMRWSESAGKAIVIVGDAPSHLPSECPYGRDYREETKALAEAGVRIYSVWCSQSKESFDSYSVKSRELFQWLAEVSEGKFLHLNDIDNLCDLLVAVAMKECGKLDDFVSRLLEENRMTESKIALLKNLGS